MSDLSSNAILDIYTAALRIRRFEEQVGKLFAQGQRSGFVHLYVGEDMAGAGCAALRV
ncbi:MAG: hypothetical protein R2873_10620 [Caldilineaceae bacterium]